MSAQSYFDFHFHPVFKQFITEFEEHYPTKRLPDDLCKEMDLTNDLLDFIDEVALHILQSQSCLSQIREGNVKLGVANIASIEFGIADGEGFLSKVLRSRLTDPMDQKYMQTIRRGDVSYYRLFLKELDLYRKLSAHKTLNFLTRKKAALIGENQFNVVLGIEGGHNLCRRKIGSMVPDRVAAVDGSDPVYTDFQQNPELGPVESLQHLQQALWDSDMDLFCLTLTHLTFIPEQFLASHAFGLKLIQHPAFYPKGNGLSQLGKEVIDAAYGMQVEDRLASGEGLESRAEGGGKSRVIKAAGELTRTVNNAKTEKIKTPIFIDVKHMSLKSRLDFYAYRAEKGYGDMPIIATHMGISGYSIGEWQDNLQQTALLKKGEVQVIEIMTNRKKAGEWGFINKSFTYNPWSINLMDEDITEILESRGLIGLSLDVRILGFQAAIGMSSKDQSEYLSVEDFKTYFPNVKVSGLAVERMPSDAQVESFLKPTKEERHPLCLCFNILHVVSVGLLTTNANPWDHLCIGSDFDGLIDPVKICRDISKMPDLERDVLRWLPVAEKAYLEQNGGPQMLPKGPNGEVKMDELKKLVRNIMFENGRKFIQISWLKVSGANKSSVVEKQGQTIITA